MDKTGREGAWRWGRGLSWGGAICVAMALLVILPSAVASTPALSIKAPYSGRAYSYVSAGFGGCSNGTATWARNPFFNLTTGHAYVSTGSIQPACKTGFANVYSLAETEFSSMSFSMPSGHHSLKVKWTASYSVDLVATPGPSSQTAYAGGEVYLLTYVLDATNGTYIYETHYTEFSYSISTGSLVKSFSGAKLESFNNGTFVSSHSYEVYAYFEVYSDAGVSSGASTASSTINVGTSGERATLESIT